MISNQPLNESAQEKIPEPPSTSDMTTSIQTKETVQNINVWRPKEYSFDKPKRAICFDWTFQMTNLQERKVISERKGILMQIIKKLGFEVPNYISVADTRNLSKKDLIYKLQEFARYCRGDCSCIFVSLSSHGCTRKTEDGTLLDRIVTMEGEKVIDSIAIEEIVDVFRNFKGIPKIFFIQACRHTENVNASTNTDNNSVFDRGLLYTPVDKIEEEYEEQSTKNGSNEQATNEEVIYSPPCLDDSVILFSAPVGKKAVASEQSGGHVFEELKNILEKETGDVVLRDLFRKLNYQLSYKHITNQIHYKPLVSICYRLTKDIVFKNIKK